MFSSPDAEPRRLSRAAALLLFMSLTSTVSAAPGSPELTAAEQALKEQLPEVAIVKLQRLLTTPKLPEETQKAAQILLEEAGVRAGKPETGAATTPEVNDKSAPELIFWRAAALQAQGQYLAALELLEALPTDDKWPLLEQAKFNRASVLMGLGDAAAAIKLLAALATSEDPATSLRAKLWLAETQLQQRDLPAAQATLASLPALGAEAEKNFLLGKLEFAQGHASQAAQRFFLVVQSTDKKARKLDLPAKLGLAKSQRVQGERAAAARTLSEIIAAGPEQRFLDLAFQEFRLANIPPDAELEKLLVGWANSTDAAVSAPSILALIESREASGKLDEALQFCTAFQTKYPTHPFLIEVLLRQSRMLITQGKGELALQMLVPLQQASQPPQVQAWAAEVLGYAKLRAENFTEASKAFKLVTEQTPDPERKLLGAFQTALATLQASPPDALPDLSELQLTPALESDLQLERGLYAASKAAPDTERYLQTFLKKHQDHPRAFEAALALAEFTLRRPTNPPEVMRDRLQLAQQLAKTPAEIEKLSLLSLHFDSMSATPEAFAKKVDEYLLSHPPGSAARAELLFKLAQRLHNGQQYAAAKARFLQLVTEEPDASDVEAALFFAGKAALGSQAKGCEAEAIKLWDKVAQGKGPLRLHARLEQGKLDQRRDPAAALQIFDAILKANPPPEASMKYQVLCLRGETLLAVNPEVPTKLKEAMESFEQVLSSATATLYWKQQAQVRKGDCLVGAKREAEALEAYYEAMNLTPMATTASDASADYFWFFRAGEKAMRLLEAKQNWKAAVAIAQKLAEAPGPRADNARERANRLITEHYLWQEE